MASAFETGQFGNQYMSEQQRIADMLRQAGISEQQAMQPVENQGGMIQSGPFSMYAGDGGYGLKTLAKALQGYTAGKQRTAAEAASTALGERYRSEGQDAMAKGLRALQGTPGTPENAPESIGGEPAIGPTMPGTAAIAPDKMAAMQAFSSHPMTAGASNTILAEMLKTPDSPYAKINPKDFTRESLVKFAQTKNPADLMAVRKMDNVGGIATDMYSQKPGDVLPQNPNDLMQRGPDKVITVNQPLLTAKKDIARSGASSQIVRLPPQENAEAKKVGEMFGTDFVKTQQAGAGANTKIAKLDRMSQLLDGVDTGKLTPAGTDIAAYAASLGLNIDKNLPNKQAATALSAEIALELRNPSGGAGMPGAMSDKDREFLQSMTPSLAQTPGANKLIIETGKKLAKRDQDVAKLARDYRAKKGSLDAGFYDELQKFSDANQMFTGMGLAQQPNSIGGGVKFMGWVK